MRPQDLTLRGAVDQCVQAISSIDGTLLRSFRCLITRPGALTIAGAEKSVNLDVTATRLSDGGIRADGELPLLMTDFGVKPPTAMLGTLRTSNKVTVKFSLLVGPETIAAAVAGVQR